MAKVGCKFLIQTMARGKDDGLSVGTCRGDEAYNIISEQRFSAGESNGDSSERLDLFYDVEGTDGVEASFFVPAITAMGAVKGAFVRYGKAGGVRDASSVYDGIEKPVESL